MAPRSEQKPDAFLSYTRFDNEFSGGAISKFRDQLAAHVRALTGKPFNIFQDVDGIGLGEHWPNKLDDMLNQTRFFLPILTPSYFESKLCRLELESFLDAEAKVGRKDLILPIYWTECELLDEETLRSEDSLAATLHDRQHHDWRPLVFKAIKNAEVQRSLQDLARKIRNAKRRSINSVTGKHQEVTGDIKRNLVQVVKPEAVSEAGISNRFLRPAGAVLRDVDEAWCPEMVVIPAGVFMMGSPKDEVERRDNESPQHQIEIDKPFLIGRFPVTRGEFAAFVEDTGHIGKSAQIWTGSGWKNDENADWQSPGFDQTDRHPVVGVNNEDALAYFGWLSRQTGRSYVLPSEAMWEYACRAGTTTPFWTEGSITTDRANYNGNYPYIGSRKGVNRQATTEVDHFDANPFGLNDMHGNVWEWCSDLWHETYSSAPSDGAAWLEGASMYRVVRGGAWNSFARHVRSACRVAFGPSVRNNFVGFRCAGVLM